MNIRRELSLLAGGIVLATTLFGQFPPTDPHVDGIYHGASYLEPDEPGVGIAPGSMFVVKGFVLGPDRLQMGGFPFQTTLGGTSVQVSAKETVRTKTWDALIVYASYGQLAAILPSDVPVGRATIAVTHEGKTSRVEPMWVVESSFGMFTRNQAGSGPGIIQNFVSQTELPVNSLIEPARPGQVAIIWGTGLGAVDGDESVEPLPGDMDIPLEVLVGGVSAKVLYKGRSGCCVGTDQIVFEVPETVEGCYVPVGVRAGGEWSNFTTMSIASSGDVCPDLPGLNAAALDKLRQGQPVSFGRVDVGRICQTSHEPEPSWEMTSDIGIGHFAKYPAQDVLASQSTWSVWTTGMPSPGYCTVISGDIRGFLLPPAPDPLMPRDLRDAGDTLNLDGPLGPKQLPGSSGWYGAYLGGLVAESGETWPEYLIPGTYVVANGNGGEQVGAFEATFTVPASVMWTNRDDLSEIRRDQDLTATWSSSASADQLVVVYVESAESWYEGHSKTILCAAQAGAGQFTVPSWMLSQLPISGTIEGFPLAYLGLITVPTVAAQARFSASGVDDGRCSYLMGDFKLIGVR